MCAYGQRVQSMVVRGTLSSGICGRAHTLHTGAQKTDSKSKPKNRTLCRASSHLQRGTGQSDVVQLLACRLSRHHIFLQRWQPPVTFCWHCTACWNRARTLRQLVLLHCGLWQLQGVVVQRSAPTGGAGGHSMPAWGCPPLLLLPPPNRC